jgi:hypothetical protein
MGAHGRVAASVADTVTTSGFSAAGRRSPARAMGRENKMRPAVAPADKAKETSKATMASPRDIATSDHPKERAALDRRPRVRARNAAVSIHAARRVEPPFPANSA